MAIYTETRLYGPAYPATSATTVYTTPAAVTTIIKQVVLANTTGSAATVTLRIVPTGQATAAQYSIAEAVSIAPNSTVTLDLAQVLNPGDFITAHQGTSSAVAVTISGVQKA
jgi:hypothetical protein